MIAGGTPAVAVYPAGPNTYWHDSLFACQSAKEAQILQPTACSFVITFWHDPNETPTLSTKPRCHDQVPSFVTFSSTLLDDGCPKNSTSFTYDIPLFDLQNQHIFTFNPLQSSTTMLWKPHICHLQCSLTSMMLYHLVT